MAQIFFAKEESPKVNRKDNHTWASNFFLYQDKLIFLKTLLERLRETCTGEDAQRKADKEIYLLAHAQMPRPRAWTKAGSWEHGLSFLDGRNPIT